MAWMLIIVAGLFEVAMALCLKLSKGFTVLVPSLGVVVFAGISFGLLNLGLKQLEVGTAYAVWVGIGAVGTALAGMLLMDESASPLKIAALTVIIVGVIGLNLADAH